MESPSIIDIDHQYLIWGEGEFFWRIASIIADRFVVAGFFVIDQVRGKIISQCSVCGKPPSLYNQLHTSQKPNMAQTIKSNMPCTNKSAWRKSQSQWIVHFALIILTFVPYRRTCLPDLIVKSEKVYLL